MKPVEPLFQAADEAHEAPVTVHAQLPGGGMVAWSDEQLQSALAAMERARQEQIEEMRCGRCSSWRELHDPRAVAYGGCMNITAVSGVLSPPEGRGEYWLRTHYNFGCRFFTAKPLSPASVAKDEDGQTVA